MSDLCQQMQTAMDQDDLPTRFPNPSSLAIDTNTQLYSTQIQLINSRLEDMTQRFIRLETMLFTKDSQIFESIKDLYSIVETLLQNDTTIQTEIKSLRETQLKIDLSRVHRVRKGHAAEGSRYRHTASRKGSLASSAGGSPLRPRSVSLNDNTHANHGANGGGYDDELVDVEMDSTSVPDLDKQNVQNIASEEEDGDDIPLSRMRKLSSPINLSVAGNNRGNKSIEKQVLFSDIDNDRPLSQINSKSNSVDVQSISTSSKNLGGMQPSDKVFESTRDQNAIKSAKEARLPSLDTLRNQSKSIYDTTSSPNVGVASDGKDANTSLISFQRKTPADSVMVTAHSKHTGSNQVSKRIKATRQYSSNDKECIIKINNLPRRLLASVDAKISKAKGSRNMTSGTKAESGKYIFDGLALKPLELSTLADSFETDANGIHIPNTRRRTNTIMKKSNSNGVQTIQELINNGEDDPYAAVTKLFHTFLDGKNIDNEDLPGTNGLIIGLYSIMGLPIPPKRDRPEYTENIKMDTSQLPKYKSLMKEFVTENWGIIQNFAKDIELPVKSSNMTSILSSAESDTLRTPGKVKTNKTGGSIITKVKETSTSKPPKLSKSTQKVSTKKQSIDISVSMNDSPKKVYNKSMAHIQQPNDAPVLNDIYNSPASTDLVSSKTKKVPTSVSNKQGKISTNMITATNESLTEQQYKTSPRPGTPSAYKIQENEKKNCNGTTANVTNCVNTSSISSTKNKEIANKKENTPNIVGDKYTTGSKPSANDSIYTEKRHSNSVAYSAITSVAEGNFSNSHIGNNIHVNVSKTEKNKVNENSSQDANIVFRTSINEIGLNEEEFAGSFNINSDGDNSLILTDENPIDLEASPIVENLQNDPPVLPTVSNDVATATVTGAKHIISHNTTRVDPELGPFTSEHANKNPIAPSIVVKPPSSKIKSGNTVTPKSQELYNHTNNDSSSTVTKVNNPLVTGITDIGTISANATVEAITNSSSSIVVADAGISSHAPGSYHRSLSSPVVDSSVKLGGTLHPEIPKINNTRPTDIGSAAYLKSVGKEETDNLLDNTDAESSDAYDPNALTFTRRSVVDSPLQGKEPTRGDPYEPNVTLPVNGNRLLHTSPDFKEPGVINTNTPKTINIGSSLSREGQNASNNQTTRIVTNGQLPSKMHSRINQIDVKSPTRNSLSDLQQKLKPKSSELENVHYTVGTNIVPDEANTVRKQSFSTSTVSRSTLSTPEKRKISKIESVRKVQSSPVNKSSNKADLKVFERISSHNLVNTSQIPPLNTDDKGLLTQKYKNETSGGEQPESTQSTVDRNITEDKSAVNKTMANVDIKKTDTISDRETTNDDYDLEGIYNALKQKGLPPHINDESKVKTMASAQTLPSIDNINLSRTNLESVKPTPKNPKGSNTLTRSEREYIRYMDVLAMTQDDISRKFQSISGVRYSNSVMWTRESPPRGITVETYLNICFYKALTGADRDHQKLDLDLPVEVVNESKEIIEYLEYTIMTKRFQKSLLFFFCEFIQKYCMAQSGLKLNQSQTLFWKKEKSLILLIVFWRDITRSLRDIPEFTLFQALLELENYRIYTNLKISTWYRQIYQMKQFLTSCAGSSRTASWMYPTMVQLPQIGMKGITKFNIFENLELLLQVPTNYMGPRYSEVRVALTSTPVPSVEALSTDSE